VADIIRYDDQQGAYNLASGISAMTVQAYRDTAFQLEHCRHDQDDVVAYFRFQMSHRRRLGSALASCHIHYIPCGANPASPQNVRFQLLYSWQDIGGTFPANAGWTTATSDLAIGTADQYKDKVNNLLTGLAAPAGEGYSSWLLIAITRLGTDPADTYTQSNPHGAAQANLAILGVDCHIQVDRDGSLAETSD